MKPVTYVFGHKNPDTDSVVSATAFACLKNAVLQRQGKEAVYTAARAGKLSPQTEYIYKKFQLKPPVFISDLSPKVDYFMMQDYTCVEENQSLQFASALLQKNDYRFLIVTDSQNRFKAVLHYSAFAKNLIASLNPEHHFKVFTNLKLLHQSLNPIFVSDASVFEKNTEVTECTLMTGAADIESFKHAVDSRPEQKFIVITGDRDDIVEAAVERNVYCIVISGSRTVSSEIIQKAKEKGVCILVTAYDTFSSSLLAAYAAPVSKIADYSLKPVKKTDSVLRIKNLLRETKGHTLPVVDDDGVVTGVISESSIHQESAVSVSLVDHNEMSQAVDGIENYTIREIIDHHRIGSISTKYPVTFINKVLGSTATIIAGLYQEENVPLSKEMAGLLLAGILSDTLILKSSTVTDVDIETAEKLSEICGLDIQSFGEEIIHAGCRISHRSDSELISQDLKEYTEGQFTFTVSQIEVDNTHSVLARKEKLLEELEKEMNKRSALFSALLITDITKLDSLLLIKGDGQWEPFAGFPKLEENVYLLKSIVSRKKQLIPLISELISKLQD